MTWWKLLLLALCLALAMTAIVFMLDREGFWKRIAGDADSGRIDFESLAKTGKPNEALACPAGLCRGTEPDIVIGSYAATPSQLREAILAELAGDPLYHRVDDDGDPLHLRFVAHSPFMRYPDLVNIEIVPQDGGTVSIAAHARAQLGYSDAGANRRRVERILAAVAGFTR